METLIVKNKTNTRVISQTLFKSEEEFETLVFNTPEILTDIFPIKRQVRGSNKSGIPDIIGIDQDGNICIIEMKNITVDANVIPQVLEYALWAETYPDSIRSLWLECKNKPEDLDINWDNIEVRIVIIAPKILNSTLNFVDKINYSVDLFEVKQYLDNDTKLLFVNKLEADKEIKKVKPVSGQEVYDEKYYKKERNLNSVPEFMKYVNEVEQLIKEKDWQLEKKFNKYYCGFKYGFFNAFSINWVGTKSFAFCFKISKEEAEKFEQKFTKYDTSWKQALYYIEPGVTKTKDFVKLFESAYKKILG
ncbi:hypothetical protein AGMMS49942_07560 [Spirochaetia bacterium]|nr:hypothetical protein AGMMS49942_07560 [Spirochaetia bacterium]